MFVTWDFIYGGLVQFGTAISKVGLYGYASVSHERFYGGALSGAGDWRAEVYVAFTCSWKEPSAMIVYDVAMIVSGVRRTKRQT